MMPFTGMLGALFAAVLCAITGATVEARYPENYRNSFIFNRAAELPGGRTLQPGKYVFRIVDSQAGRHILEILNEHETKILATILAVDPSEEAVIMFGETPADAPQPIRYWYHSRRTNGRIGYEFVYPTDQATRIANATNQRVLATDLAANNPDAMMRARVRTVHPDGAIAGDRNTPRRHAQRAVEDNRFNVTGTTGTAGTTSTDSPIPPLMMIGLITLGAVLVAVWIQRRSQPRLLAQLLDRPLGSGRWAGPRGTNR